MKLCFHDYKGAKSALLHNFAEQRMKAPRFCGAKNTWLHDFAAQSLHCSIILWAKSAWLQNFAGQRHSFKSKNYLKIFWLITVISEIYSTMVTSFKEKKSCGMVPLKKYDCALLHWRTMNVPHYIEGLSLLPTTLQNYDCGRLHWRNMTGSHHHGWVWLTVVSTT